jgi:hypothetical protein
MSKMYVQRARHSLAVAAFVVTALLPAAALAAADANPVVEWNRIALRAVTVAAQGPVPQTRTLAIVQASVHDAVASILGEYELYAPSRQSRAWGSPRAAAIAAAHHALVALFPAQAAALDADYATSLAGHRLNASNPGIAAGIAAATRILALRATDGAAAASFPYTAPSAGEPGVWVPTPPAFAPALLPGWGAVATWVLRDASQFRPTVGPPALRSHRFAAEFREVQELGALNSIVRTAEQTQIARFWVASAGIIWNDVLQQIVAGKYSSLSDSARAFALLNIAGADAAIACWNAKYYFNSWRPVTAIRQADTFPNRGLFADPTWEPLIPTLPFPEFPSGHTTISSAMATILAALFEDDPGVPFVAQSPTAPGFVRNWMTFGEGVDEVIEARIYSGLHFRTADERGAKIGRRVAKFVVGHALREKRHGRH